MENSSSGGGKFDIPFSSPTGRRIRALSGGNSRSYFAAKNRERGRKSAEIGGWRALWRTLHSTVPLRVRFRTDNDVASVYVCVCVCVAYRKPQLRSIFYQRPRAVPVQSQLQFRITLRENFSFSLLSFLFSYLSLSLTLYYSVKLHRAAIISEKKIRIALCFVMRVLIWIFERRRNFFPEYRDFARY